MRATWFAVFLMLASSEAAKAEWFYKAEENPFEGDQHMGAAIDLTGYLAGFRCSSEEDLTLIFVTPEKIDSSMLALLRAAPMKLLVIVDSADKISLDAQLEATPDGERYRLSASGPEVKALIFDAVKSKRRFAVAQEAFGKVGHSKTFSSRGSTSVLQKLIGRCNLKLESN